MLKGIKKKLGLLPDANQEEQVEMTSETTQAEMSVIAAELTELKASFAQVSASLAASQAAQLATEEQLKEATAALAAVAEEKAAAELAVKQAQTDARLTKLQGVVGDVKAAELMVAFEGLDEKVFEAMVGTLSANMATEAASPQFTEKGIDAAVTAPAEADMVTRLAAKIEAQFAPKTDAK